MAIGIPAAMMISSGIGGLGSVVGGLFGKSGQEKANEMNLQIARENRAWQEKMTNSAYQRAAADMDKAGLNRILALGKPASTPSGNIATMQNANAPLASGVLNASNIAANTALQIAQAKNLNARTNAIGGVSAVGEQAKRLVNWIVGNTMGEGDGKTPVEPKGMWDRFMEDAGNTLKKLWWMPGNQNSPGSPGQADAQDYANQILQELKQDTQTHNNILTFVKKMDHPPGLTDDQLILWALSNPERVKAYRQRNFK